MTLPRTVADVLDDHVVFQVESIDRMYLHVWQPRPAYGGGVQGFFVLFVGRAREKAGVWRTQRPHNSVTGDGYAWLVGSSAFINFFYSAAIDL